jgi:hypothetical protein
MFSGKKLEGLGNGADQDGASVEKLATTMQGGMREAQMGDRQGDEDASPTSAADRRKLGALEGCYTVNIGSAVDRVGSVKSSLQSRF